MKLPQKDYYKLLEVSPLATTEEINQAFKRLARKYHPDTTQNPVEKKRLQEIYQQLVDAHQFLRDEEKRKEYDNNVIFKFRTLSKSQVKAKIQNVVDKNEPWWKKILFFGKKEKEKEDPLKKAEQLFFLGMSMTARPDIKMIQTAVSYFEQAYKANPQLLEALFNAAVGYYKIGEFEKAKNLLKEYLAKRPSDQAAEMLYRIINW
ncbi:MAG: DnaJ domain-containing protein [Candidatus Calescibacterium sp.]|nr:DnaJ domain-containing protein [Candidatus Calescibacterium sp.]MCX7972394.1 DnaJ domain-containing protein [bacterium]MDW8195715.1 DnaJ domain-containing protein [Candidatus Calescibacterium sp.]